MDEPDRKPTSPTLDPADWTSLREAGHRMLDDMLDYLAQVRSRPVWQPMPEAARARFREPLPREGVALDAAYEDFARFIAPYAAGNVHPRFLGWVHGGGTAVGMLAEMLAAALDANLGGRDHAPIAVERQVAQWAREMFAFPETASGIFVTGTSMANLVAILIARRARLGEEVRTAGLGPRGGRLRAYGSTAAHRCIPQAMDIAGFGREALRLVPVDARHRMDLAALRARVAQDRAAGDEPFLVIATAGTVDAGATDDLAAIADFCRAENLWFHVDGAFGALAVLSERLKPLVAGIERAHSIAFDFHKWTQVPYDAGFILVRDGAMHRDTFALPAAYLRRETRGLGGGDFWPSDYGPDLSRGFRALKTWFTIKTYGVRALGAVLDHTCALARALQARVEAEPELELLAPAQLNIVCFRYRGPEADRLNADIVADLQESGIAAPSTTMIGGRLAIRAAFVNHRTQMDDIAILVDAVLRFGRKRTR